jgi:hypothetical protein
MIFPLATMSRWPVAATLPCTCPAITTSRPRTSPCTHPLSPTMIAAADSTDPTMVPSMRKAPSALRSPCTLTERPSTFSI